MHLSANGKARPEQLRQKAENATVTLGNLLVPVSIDVDAVLAFASCAQVLGEYDSGFCAGPRRRHVSPGVARESRGPLRRRLSMSSR
jgi:hypothetical protein